MRRKATAGSGGRRLDAALQLLDHQLIDRDGRLVGKVDDLELTQRADGRLVVTAILSGPGALGPRLPGVLRRSVLAVWRRLHDDTDPQSARIPWSAVSELGSAVKLSAARQDLPNQGLENWARTSIVGKLPGAGHAPE
jgi:sporulation protein YlmC with PRC-barrel domain